MMTTLPRMMTVALLAGGVAGCHFPADRWVGNPERLNAGGAGRAETTAKNSGGAPAPAAPAAADFYPTVRATLAALDDMQVRPEALTIENGAQADRPLRSGDLAGAASNAALLPADQPATREIFGNHRLPTTRPGAPVVRFDPVGLDYHGQGGDGRPVAVVVRTSAADAGGPGLDISARIGPDGAGDEAWSRAFLARVSARLAEQARPPAPEPPPRLK